MDAMARTAIKERPIPFTAPMVRAIQSLQKTQTRRLVTPQPPMGAGPVRYPWFTNNQAAWPVFGAVARNESANHVVRCRYGQPGDQLWVKETWASPARQLVAYRAGGECGAWMGDSAGGRLWVHHGYILEAPGYPWGLERLDTYGLRKYGGKWKSGRFMPRWASRITLEITGLRVERLQDITEADAIAEGCYSGRFIGTKSVVLFRTLWDSINAKKYPWASNPWVWVIEFRPVPAGK